MAHLNRAVKLINSQDYQVGNPDCSLQGKLEFTQDYQTGNPDSSPRWSDLGLTENWINSQDYQLGNPDCNPSTFW